MTIPEYQRRCEYPVLRSDPYKENGCARRGTHIGSDERYYCGAHAKKIAAEDAEKRAAIASAEADLHHTVKLARYIAFRSVVERLTEEIAERRDRLGPLEDAVNRLGDELRRGGVDPTTIYERV